MSSQSPQPKPRIRLDKKEAKKGDVIEVKSLVSHVMESGQRRDASGKVIPRKIINKFTAELNGKTIFAADIEPAVSANPYMQFKFKAQESGTIRFTWTDDDGTKITAEEKITVT
jgi:sulfur-oxidizing protein SoxZ